MLIKTLLNKCYPVKGFVYGKVSLENETICVEINERKNSKANCSCCHQRRPTYDHIKERRFKFVPLWGINVKFIYRPRRVNCLKDGIKIELIPWADGKSPVCQPFKLFLAHWAKLLSWKEVAVQFKVSWHNVFESVQHVVQYGLEHRNLDNVKAIGVDEIQYLKGHKYLTLVYQIDVHCRRLLFVGKDRKVKTLLRFFYRFGKQRTQQLQVICSDLWKPYLKVIKRKAKDVVHILDRFHIMKYLNAAVDKTRRQETAQLIQDGYEPILVKSKYCWLKNKCNQSKFQLLRLKDLLQYNLRTVRCYLHKEEFQLFWNYKTRWGAQRFFKAWSTRAMRSKLPELKKTVKSLRKHQKLLLNYFSFKERFSNGIVEGLNLKAKLTMRKSYGFKRFETIEIALFHTLGHLPEPLATHRFY
ncbi:MAG: ISL3 family transposase [Candidatus Heimdallarchaeota archaeon]|nr:ISL3 family transposase [Candidatus Heimdallarchaeota archaeon]